jgi:putative ABC transport system permease protein
MWAWVPEDADGRSDVGAARIVPGVAAATTSGWAASGRPYDERLRINGQAIESQMFGDDGSIRPAVRRGRAPSAPGEVALGAATLATLGLEIGDEIELGLGTRDASLHGMVVGEVVLASPWFISFPPGTGAATLGSTFTALGAPQDVTSQVVVIRYENGVDELRTFNAVEEALGSYRAFEASDRHGVTGLDRIRLVPVLLLVGLFALVAAAVAHVLLLSVGRHRRDIAVRRAMGFTKRQSRSSVMVHGCLVALAACAVGIPLGGLAGRAVWDKIAGELAVVPRPTVPLLQLVVITIALVGIANLAAVLPAHRAARVRPAAVLRAD